MSSRKDFTEPDKRLFNLQSNYHNAGLISAPPLVREGCRIAATPEGHQPYVLALEHQRGQPG